MSRARLDQPLKVAARGPTTPQTAGRVASLVEPWFAVAEYRDRLGRLQAAARDRGLDGILLFQPESVTWLTGFFTRGYASFQFAAVPVSGDPEVCCRDVEAYYLDRTCVFDGRALWSDGDSPLSVGVGLIRRVFGPAARLGIELGAWPLNAARFEALKRALPDTLFVDAGDLAARPRLVKSPAEVELMRRAARAAEAGMRAAAEAARPGASERDLAAAVSAAMIRAGSDLPGPGVLSSGEGAFHLHGSYTDRVFARGDTIQLETLPCVRHYHARFMRPIKVARASDADRKLAARLVEIQDIALREVAPGVAATLPDALYRRGLRESGLAERYTNKTFYSVGLLLAPSGGEALDAHPEASWRFEAGMTFHSYLLARDFGMSETILITESGHERLTRYPRALIVGGG
jgi:Xaa-Pro dipeptidase